VLVLAVAAASCVSSDFRFFFADGSAVSSSFFLEGGRPRVFLAFAPFAAADLPETDR